MTKANNDFGSEQTSDGVQQRGDTGLGFGDPDSNPTLSLVIGPTLLLGLSFLSV